MKIAIYHNLERGGALNALIETLKYLHKKNEIDLFSFKENIPKKLINSSYFFKLSKTKNIFEHVFQVMFELKSKNKKIAKIINNGKYDLILIYPCLLTQSPYILKYINNDKYIYFFSETKREFYEQTSFDYWTLKKIITRIIRTPIKFIDKKNCQFAKHIISNSKFTSKNLFKIYNKKSKIIYPGLKPIDPIKIKIRNNKKILSVGQISKIKGYDFSIKQIHGITNRLSILGRETNESKKIYKLAKNNNITLNLIKTENNNTKNKTYKKYSIYLANSNNEPFGIATLEATANNCFVLGRKEGGTPEIIKNKVNGYLYSNLEEARKILKQVLRQKELIFYQINTIDWEYTTNKIVEYYNRHIKHD